MQEEKWTAVIPSGVYRDKNVCVWEENLYHRGRRGSRESFREGKGDAEQGLEG